MKKDLSEDFLDRVFNKNENPEITEIEKACIKNINENPEKYLGYIKVSSSQALKRCIVKGIKYFGNDGNFNWIGLMPELNSLSTVFSGMKDFNGDITKWDVSNIVSLNHTFFGCKSFKRDLSEWDNSEFKYLISTFGNSDYPYKNVINKWYSGPSVISSIR